MDPNQDVLPYDGHKTNPDILVSNCSASDPVVSVCNGGDDQLHQGKRKRKKNGSTSIPFSSVGTSACSDGDEQLQKRGRQSHQVTFALSDVFIMSDDGCWKEGLLNYLKKKRPHLRFTSKEDWICGKSKIDNLIISTERSKLVVIGFTVNPETDYSSYAAHSVVEGMLEAKTLDDKRLIVVKLAENAEIPSAFLPLTVANASEDNFLPALLKIVDECDVKNTLFEGNVKAIIGRGLTRHNMKEELVAEFAKDWSLNFEEDCDSTVVSNENEIDICIVSADNEWETEVCKMLRKERSGRSKLNVISIHEFFSTFGHPRNIISDAVTIEKFVKCVYTSKKVVIGFGTKDNGYPNLIAGIVFNKIGSENKHFEQLIPVKLSTDAILAETVKYLEPLDGSLHGDVVENILKTLDLHHVRLKVSCQNRNSENFATIEDKLNEYVEDFEDHCNPLLKRIKKYFSEKGLTLNGITIGCILLHLSAPDAKTLQCLSDIDMRREFMEELAKFLLPQSLHVEFTQEWSMNIYNEENVHGPGIFPSLNVVHSNKAKVSEKGSNFTNTITSANDIAALLKVQPKLEPNTGSSFRSCANDSDIISSRGSTLTDFVQYVCDQESVNQKHGMTGNANTKKAGFILATPAMARPVAITRSTGQTGALSITNPIIGSTPDQQQVSRDEYTSSFAGEVENLSRGGTRRLNTNDMSRIWDYGGQPIYHSIHHLFGGTALRNACENGHVECAKLLIDAGADVHVKADFGGTALRNACENGHVECAKLLIDAGADVHVKADFGGTALRNACENGHVECAKLLIDAGADVHVKADFGGTALRNACENGHVECAKLLIDAGADVHVKADFGGTALRNACENGHVECAKLLIDAGADVHVKADFGGTALRNACENGHVECAKLLIDAGADVHVKADFGGTALRNACENGHVECAKLLIDAGADVHVKADFGGTALRNACENGHVECAKLLIDAGADVHVKADDGFTLLHSCFLRPEGTYAKHLSVSIALLKHERNMAFIKNKDGHSALDMYQCHKCEAYSDKTRSAQKEELLLILKGRIPRDIMLKGRDTVLIFLKALKGGSEIFEKCCVSVVGQARAGKTSLIKRLTGQRFNSKEEETDGIVTTKTCKIDENRKKWKLETKQSDGKRQTAEGLSLKIYDFAGQELYYTTHQVFMMSRAVFMLVFNLTLDLNAKALIEIRADHQLKDFPKWMVKVATFIGCKGNVKVYELDMTNLDFINYWLSSIYAHTEENKQKDGIQVEQLSPPVFIVGTHENSLPGNKSQRNAKVKEIFGILRRILRRKPYEEHVVARFYAVDSSLRDDEEIQKLQSHILKVVQEQPYMNELVPAAWMEFERALEEKLQNNVHWIARKEVSEIATICKVTASELPALLQFQHDTGNCVHFVNTANVDDPLNHYIILNQMWLNCIFKGVITIKPEQQQLAVFRGSWERLAGQGLLDEKLARHVWREFEIDPNLLFGLMSRFDLLCEIQFSAEESARSLAERTRVFCVPCCLSETIEAPTVVEDDNCTVRFFVDFAGFLPNGLFFRLMVRAIRFSQARGGRNQCLSSCSAEFYVDQDHHLILRIFSKDRTFMEVIIVRVAGGRTNPSPAVCQMVFEFLMAALKDLCNIWSKGVKFTFGIPCDQCQDETDKLHLHTFDECRQALTVPCKGRRMNTEQFQRLFVKEHHHSTWPGFSLCLDKQRPPSSIGFAVDESIFRRVLLNISQNINEDINIWKVALKDHIMKANVVIHEATSVNQLFDALIDSAFLKAEDISILLETIKLTGVLRLQKCIPNCPRLDTVKITHFSKFRKSVMAFGMELTDDDIKLIVQCYDLHRRYNDKWSLVMDLEKYVILADDDKSMNAFKTSLDQLGLRRLSRRFEC